MNPQEHQDFIAFLVDELKLDKKAAEILAKGILFPENSYYYQLYLQKFGGGKPAMGDFRGKGVNYETYGASLYDYLSRAISEGVVTTDEANEYLAEAESAVKQGTSLDALPFLNELVDYQVQSYNVEPQRQRTTVRPETRGYQGEVAEMFSGLRQRNPYGLYQAQLTDYLSGLVTGGQISNAQAKQYLNEGLTAIGQGLAVEELPYYQDIERATGPETSALMNQFLNKDVPTAESMAKERYEARLAQMRELAQGQARMRPYEENAARYQDIYNQGPEFPVKTTSDILQGLSPNQRGYFGSRLGNIAGELELTNPGAREDWWKRKTSQDAIAASLRERATRYEESPNAADYQDKLADIQSELATLEANKVGTDPLENWYKNYPFLNRWAALTPQERGYSSQKFRRSTRFI